MFFHLLAWMTEFSARYVRNLVVVVGVGVVAPVCWGVWRGNTIPNHVGPGGDGP